MLFADGNRALDALDETSVHCDQSVAAVSAHLLVAGRAIAHGDPRSVTGVNLVGHAAGLEGDSAKGGRRAYADRRWFGERLACR